MVTGLLVGIAPVNQAAAATYVTISGQVTNSAGVPMQSPSIALARVSTGEIVGNLDSLGKYSINVPAGSPFDLTFVLYEEGSLISSGSTFDVNRSNPGFSNWKTSFTSLQEDKVVNFKLPPFFQLDVKVTDAQNILMNNVVLSQSEGNQDHNPYILNGMTWTGIQRSASNFTRFNSKTGLFIFQFYPTDNFKGFSYWQTTDLITSAPGSGINYTPPFSITSSKSIQLCIPVNFGNTKSTPVSCLDNQIAAEAKAAAELKAKQEAEAKAAAELKAKQEAEVKTAAELKAKQEAEAKAAAELKAKQEAEAKASAELKAKQEAEAKAAIDKAAADLLAQQKAAGARVSATKKTTITCVKGKLVKRVTDVKPKCPAGYKVKK